MPEPLEGLYRDEKGEGMMGKRILLCVLALLLLASPAALAEPEEGTADTQPTTSTVKALIPETVDLGRWNDFNPLSYWPWRSLQIRVKGGLQQTAYLDILTIDANGQWRGLDRSRLEAEGLIRDAIEPLLAAAPEGWSGMMTHVHDGGRIQGKILSEDGGWYLEQALPETIRLAVYLPESGQSYVTQPLRLRQYQSVVEWDPATGQGRVLHQTRSGLWRMKLLLRVLAAAGLTLLACLPVLDQGRWGIFAVKLGSGICYMLLVFLLPGWFEGFYVLALVLVQLLLSAAESYLVYAHIAGRRLKPALVYGCASLAASLALGLWWLC